VGRALGVDLGARRVGLALSDPLRMISSPLMTIVFSSETALVKEIVQLCGARQADLVVLGLPVSADGSEGPGCARARRIREKLCAAGIRAELQDEAWSSRDAEGILRAAGKTRKTAKDKVDAIAASLILRDYLEGTAPR
jgi:putative Holliday junction resolvase